MKKDALDRGSLFDNGGRRSGSDRRQFSYAIIIPERRVTEERRTDFDRRKLKY